MTYKNQLSDVLASTFTSLIFTKGGSLMKNQIKRFMKKIRTETARFPKKLSALLVFAKVIAIFYLLLRKFAGC